MTSPSIFKEMTYIDVWYGDLNKFVSEFYGRPWNMAAVMELRNDSFVTVDVSSDPPDYQLPEEAERQLRAWTSQPKPEGWTDIMEDEASGPPVEIVLWDLCRRGIAPVGKYLINVSW